MISNDIKEFRKIQWKRSLENKNSLKQAIDTCLEAIAKDEHCSQRLTEEQIERDSHTEE